VDIVLLITVAIFPRIAFKSPNLIQPHLPRLPYLPHFSLTTLYYIEKETARLKQENARLREQNVKLAEIDRKYATKKPKPGIN
jgi:hypothetical protein